MRIHNEAELKEAAVRGSESLQPNRLKIAVGMATCGIASGAQPVMLAIEDESRKSGLDAQITTTGCIGYCQMEPIVDVLIPGMPKITYGGMTPERARELIQKLKQGNGVFKDGAIYRKDEEEIVVTGGVVKYTVKESNGAGEIPSFKEHPYFLKQQRIILRNCGVINPDSIDEYIARGGYGALLKVLSGMPSETVIEEVKSAGLRGRGGAGFPTGQKWEYCRETPGEIKYVICNADEGDPGAFMDRSVLESDPYSVIEGMTIGAYAIGASEGYVYVRAEYPLAIEKLKAAIRTAEEYGFLGENILESGFNFKLNITAGAGAFVCGEETGLLASIEGRVGEPRARPPFPTEKGLLGKPTNINNVKTWASVAPIISRGSGWYASMGIEGNRGTTVFSLVGKVNNNGLVEVPLGIKLREVVFDIGGGLQDDAEFKAVQTGGPSGGCIPDSLLDLAVDYEGLTDAGSMMGSGGMIVMDSNTCIVDVAKYFLEFTTDESCGKCTPCREGTKWMLSILDRITRGEGQSGDIDKLVKLGDVIKETSLCGLGSTAPNPVLSTIRHFRDEYEAHIRDKSCPAGICRDLIMFRILSDSCTGCTLCAKECPVDAIVGDKKQPHVIDPAKCIKCRACYEVCKFDAVAIVSAGHIEN